MALVVIDPGHGGSNPGAVYMGRQEKDDVLALSLAVGQILEDNGVPVYYTRTTDIYESPTQKALEGNAAGADYFVSIHRNSSPYPNQYTGIETLVYNRYGEAARLARNIDPLLSIHDFRVTAGPIHTNILFDVVVPYGFRLTDAQVRTALTQGLKGLSDRYFPMIQVDHSYVEEQKP